MKICVLAYKYAIEVSPIVKNLCTYLADFNEGIVDVYVDELYRDTSFAFKNENINIKHINVEPDFIKKKFFNKTKMINKKKNTFAQKLKLVINNYNVIIAIDFWALDILYMTSVDFSKVVVLILEGPNYIANYDTKYVRILIEKCRMLIFTDNERETDFRNFIKYDHQNIKYLPVSIRFLKRKYLNRIDSKEISIIYSGYFAKWACVHELINLYLNSFNENRLLTLHGHSMGTEVYLQSAIELSKGDSSIKFNTDYFNDDEYLDYLSEFDLGIAFYNDINSDGNFSNIILSSGKIASYLFSGLGIITNIENEITLKPPFIVVKNFSETEWSTGIKKFENNRKHYKESAYALAEEFYNFDKYMGTIIDDIII